MSVREEDVKGPGTVLRSSRESALFSDLNFMTWNWIENGQTEWHAVQRCLPLNAQTVTSSNCQRVLGVKCFLRGLKTDKHKGWFHLSLDAIVMCLEFERTLGPNACPAQALISVSQVFHNVFCQFL